MKIHNFFYVSYTGKVETVCFLVVICTFRIFQVSVYIKLNSRKIHKEMLTHSTEESGSKHNTSDIYSVVSNLGWDTGYF